MEKMSTEDIIKKQQEILGKLSPEERKMALDILGEYSKIGESEVLKELLDSDYAETPADISTFLHDKKYLGNALYDQEGRFTLFPYWEEKLKEVFPDRFTTAYNTIILTGAIGLGKSTVAVICLLYMLHRLLCLKDPYLYYGLQPIDKISISLMNITLENAKGVALDKMNQMILSSEWFLAHGQMSGVSNLMFVPDKHIELITASSNNQVIGRAIFCLDGETVIKTDLGDYALRSLVGKDIKVISVDNCGNESVSGICTVKPTIMTNEEYEIILDDGTVIECTGNHSLMLEDGTYKKAKDLTLGDILMAKQSESECRLASVKRVIMDAPKQFYDVIEANPYNNFLLKTNSGYIVSHNCNFTDECLDGDTLVLTENGYVKIKDLNNIESRFATMNPETGVLEYSDPCFVRETTQSDEYYEIELEDGSIVKCTPTHRFLLKDGTYKYAKDLTEDDELDSIGFNIGSMKMKIKHISHVVTPGAKKPYYDVVNCLPYNNFLVKTDTTNIVSHNCNFGITNDVEKLKKKQKQLISQIDARMKSRFMRERAFGTYLPTLNIIASSKNSEQSFLEDYIETKKKNESKTTLIVDEPQWVVDSRKDSPEKFYVAIGNRFLANELLPLNPPKDLIDEYRAKGYTMLAVPIGYRENFEDNIDGALTDIAGIATAASLKYISGVRWNEIKTARYENPFTKEIIEVGTAKDDNLQYYNFFDLSKVSDEMRAKPLYVHLDMSRKGDKTGIAGVYVLGKKPKVEGEDSSREMFYRVAFNVSVKAPKGYEISFDKNRIFIRWLREQGFNLASISSDTFQAAQIQQQLISDGFDVKTISVDRLDPQTKQCLPYAYLKSAIYDRRLEVYKDCDFLTEEVLGLERESDGHINHPDNGATGCFTGDTKISLVDGREVSLLQLVDEFNAGKTNYVYSFNETTKRIEPGKIVKAWCTRKNASLVEVELDNGEKFRCTPNHRIMMRDGTYKEVQYLQPNDSVMPLYRKSVIKIHSITFIPEKEDVYDLTVEHNHNFALSAGIFVHNSKDAIDAVCGALFNASQNSDEIGYSYGESLENMLDINSDGSDAKQLTVALEDELRNLGPVLQPPKKDDAAQSVGEDGILNSATDFGGPTDDYNPYDNILLW